MKKLSKLKLTQLNKVEIEKRQMNVLKGGNRACTCSCYWAGQGGSSTGNNQNANYNLGDYGGDSIDGNYFYIYDGVYSTYQGAITP